MTTSLDAVPAPVPAPVPALVLVNATRFRAAHAGEWQELDRIVTRIEKRSVRALTDDELLALPSLYRATLSSLSVARATSLDRALVGYLEQLSTRAYFQIYGPPTSAGRQFARFVTHGWPAAVRALWRETIAAALLLAAAATLAYLLVRSDPSWFYAIIPGGVAGGRDPSASVETLRATIYDRHDDLLATFAASLFNNNAQVAIFCFALGFAFAVPTALLVAYNGLTLGAFLAVFIPKGLGVGFVGWLFIHGTTELFAVTIAAAAGFRIGTAIAFPGRLSRTDAAVEAGRAAATAMAGAVVMLAIAGLLEGIGRQTVLTDGSRFAIGGTMLVGWLLYFYLPRPRDALAV